MTLFTFILAWNVVGGVICILWATTNAEGWELCNPYWYYDSFQVNWFGAVVCSLIYTALCPVGAIVYWIYKLCTVWR